MRFFGVFSSAPEQPSGKARRPFVGPGLAAANLAIRMGDEDWRLTRGATTH